MDLYIIDGIAPFFRGCDQQVINWSKAPFVHLEESSGLNAERCRKVRSEFKTFDAAESAMSLNSIFQ